MANELTLKFSLASLSLHTVSSDQGSVHKHLLTCYSCCLLACSPVATLTTVAVHCFTFVFEQSSKDILTVFSGALLIDVPVAQVIHKAAAKAQL